MARPSKATVEYFPLDCQFGDSIQAVENIYGNEGFIVWVKLLQKLGRSENHIIDLRTNTAWKLFYSIFKLEESLVINILDTLSDLGCIDSVLWEHKIIYSRNFVNRVSDVYRKRKIEIIDYNAILSIYGVSGGRNLHACVVSGERNPVSGAGNPQSKLKETKVKESKEKVVVVDSNSRSAKASATHEKTEIVSGNQATTTTNFSKPTLDEVRVYAAERGNKANPDKFHAHYEGKRWKINGELMRDWKAAFRYWEQNEHKNVILKTTESSPPNSRPDCQVFQKVEYGEGVAPEKVDSVLFQQWREKAKKRI